MANGPWKQYQSGGNSAGPWDQYSSSGDQSAGPSPELLAAARAVQQRSAAIQRAGGLLSNDPNVRNAALAERNPLPDIPVIAQAKRNVSAALQANAVDPMLADVRTGSQSTEEEYAPAVAARGRAQAESEPFDSNTFLGSLGNYIAAGAQRTRLAVGDILNNLEDSANQSNGTQVNGFDVRYNPATAAPIDQAAISAIRENAAYHAGRSEGYTNRISNPNLRVGQEITNMALDPRNLLGFVPGAGPGLLAGVYGADAREAAYQQTGDASYANTIGGINTLAGLAIPGAGSKLIGRPISKLAMNATARIPLSVGTRAGLATLSEHGANAAAMASIMEAGSDAANAYYAANATSEKVRQVAENQLPESTADVFGRIAKSTLAMSAAGLPFSSIDAIQAAKAAGTRMGNLENSLAQAGYIADKQAQTAADQLTRLSQAVDTTAPIEQPSLFSSDNQGRFDSGFDSNGNYRRPWEGNAYTPEPLVTQRAERPVPEATYGVDKYGNPTVDVRGVVEDMFPDTNPGIDTSPDLQRTSPNAARQAAIDAQRQAAQQTLEGIKKSVFNSAKRAYNKKQKEFTKELTNDAALQGLDSDGEARYIAERIADWHANNPAPTMENAWQIHKEGLQAEQAAKAEKAAPAKQTAEPSAPAPAPTTSAPDTIQSLSINNALKGLRSDNEAPTTQVTADDIRSEIGNDITNPTTQAVLDLLGTGRVKLVGSASDIPDNAHAKGAAGFYDGKNTYVALDHLEKGNVVNGILGATAHEVQHGLDLSDADKAAVDQRIDNTVNHIETLANRDNPVASDIIARAKAAEAANPGSYRYEVMGYAHTVAREARANANPIKRILNNTLSSFRTMRSDSGIGGKNFNLDNMAYLSDKMLRDVAASNRSLEAVRNVNGEGLAMQKGPRSDDFRQAVREGRTATAENANGDPVSVFLHADNKADLQAHARETLLDSLQTGEPVTLREIMKPDYSTLNDYSGTVGSRGSIGDMPVIVDDAIDPQGAHYDGGDPAKGELPSIHIGSDFVHPEMETNAELRDLLTSHITHEIQHHIQKVEGLPYGAYSEMYPGTAEEQRASYDNTYGEAVARHTAQNRRLTQEELPTDLEDRSSPLSLYNQADESRESGAFLDETQPVNITRAMRNGEPRLTRTIEPESAIENNASGESSASLEAINRQRDEDTLGRTRALIDRDGSVRELRGVDAVDTNARDGQVIVRSRNDLNDLHNESQAERAPNFQGLASLKNGPAPEKVGAKEAEKGYTLSRQELHDIAPRSPGETDKDYTERVAKGWLQTKLDTEKMIKRDQSKGRDLLAGGQSTLARLQDKTEAVFQLSRWHSDRMGSAASMEAMHQYQTGGVDAVTNPMAKAFFSVYKQLEAERLEQLLKIKPEALKNLQDNYFTQLWKNPRQALQYYTSNLGKGLEGPKTFLKERQYLSYKAGMEAGLRPISYNLADLAIASLGQMDKFIIAHAIKEKLAADGQLIIADPKTSAPLGYAVTDAPMYRTPGKQVFIPSGIARDLNNQMAPSLYRNGLWRTVRGVENTIMSASLGWSAFHAGFTTIDNIISTGGTALQRLSIGDIKGATQESIKAALSAVMAPLEGMHAIREYRGLGAEQAKNYGEGLLDKARGAVTSIANAGRKGTDILLDNPVSNALGYTENHLPALIDALGSSGAIWKQSSVNREYNMALNSLARNLVQLTAPGETRARIGRLKNLVEMQSAKENAASLALGTVDAISNTISAAGELGSFLIHQHLVPAQKMAARLTLFKFELDSMVDQLNKVAPVDSNGKTQLLKKGDYIAILDAMHPDAIRAIGRRVNTLVDDRLGQINYDARFWNSNIKNLSQLLVGAPGWVWGGLRVGATGVTDLRRLLHIPGTGDLTGPEKMTVPLDKNGKLTNATYARLTSATANMIVLSLGIGMGGAILSYLLTGKQADTPEEQIKDFAAPRTGRINANGDPERFAPPTYWLDHYKWITNPEEAALGHLHPFISSTLQLARNKNYFGDPIRDTEDPWDVQAKQVAKYLLPAITPRSVSSQQNIRNDASDGERLAASFGIQEVPKHIEASKFANDVKERRNAMFADSEKAVGSFEESQPKSQLVGALRRGDTWTSSQQRYYDSLSPKEQEGIQEKAKVPAAQWNFGKLKLRDQIESYPNATDEEKARYNLRDTILNSKQKIPDNLPKRVKDRLEKQLEAIRAEGTNDSSQ